MSNFIIQPLNNLQKEKIHNDLVCVETVTKKAKEQTCRVIISGGYAVDGNIGMLTRPHNDIDIQIYSTRILKIADITALFGHLVQDKGQEEYYHSFRLEDGMVVADIYALQVVSDPFANEKVIIKRDGTRSGTQQFATKIVTLDGSIFEAQEAQVELDDKLYKRHVRHDPVFQKHDQDIANLQLLIDS